MLDAGSDEFGWVVLDPEGSVIANGSAAPSLSLPSSELARQTLEEGEMVCVTIHGSGSNVRAVSLPKYQESGEFVRMMQCARSLRCVQEVNNLILVVLPLGLGF